MKAGRRVGREGVLKGGGRGVGVGLLVRVMHALEGVAGDELDVHFGVVVFVEEGAVTGSRDGAGFHRRADAAVEDVIVLGRDLGAEDRRRGLASGNFELQSLRSDDDVVGGIQLGEWG